MREFRTNVRARDVDEMLALAFIGDPRTRKDAVELVLGRPVTPLEMVWGDVHSIITVGMDVHNDPVGTVGLLKILKGIEEQRRSG